MKEQMINQTFSWQKTCRFWKHTRALCLYCSNDAALLIYSIVSNNICSRRSGNVTGSRFLRIILSCASFPFSAKTRIMVLKVLLLPEHQFSSRLQIFHHTKLRILFSGEKTTKTQPDTGKSYQSTMKDLTNTTTQKTNSCKTSLMSLWLLYCYWTGRKRRITMDLTCWLK